MKLGKWWIILIIVGILTSVGVFLVKYNEGRIFTEGIISHISEDLSDAFGNFFLPVTQDINDVKKIIETDSILINNSIEIEYRKNFSEFLEQHNTFSSLIYKGANNDEFIIFKDRNTFISSYRAKVSRGDSIFSWNRFVKPDEISSEWVEVLHFDPKNEDWYEGSRETVYTNGIYWEGQYNSVFTKESVFAGAIGWITKGFNRHNAIAFEIPIHHLVSSLRSFNIYKQRRIFIISNDGEFIHIPTSLQDSLVIYDESNKHVLEENDSLLNYIRESIELFGSEDKNAIAFQYNGEKWWTHTTKVQFEDNTIEYGIALPEDELIFGELRRNLLYLILLILLLFTGALVYYFVRRKRVNAHIVKNDSSSIPIFGGNDLIEIIKMGENSQVEFKSSLRWGVRENKVNPKLEEVVLKTISAFSNGEGGTLFIGVNDEGDILGLDYDFSSLKKYGADYFEIHLRNLLNKQFGVTFSTTNLIISFPEVKEKQICIMKVNPGNEPVFITIADKNGNKIERFFVRSGNSSQEIQSLKEINSYVQSRFTVKNI